MHRERIREWASARRNSPVQENVDTHPSQTPLKPTEQPRAFPMRFTLHRLCIRLGSDRLYFGDYGWSTNGKRLVATAWSLVMCACQCEPRSTFHINLLTFVHA